MPRLPLISRRAALPRNNLAVLQQHERILTAKQRRFLSAVQYRIETYPDRFNRSNDHHDYAATAGLILMSDWPFRHRFCHCCMRNKKCKVWKFCSHCAYVQQRLILERYLPLYPKGAWYFVTLSFEGVLRFEAPDDEHPLPYWDAIKSALRQLLSECIIDGAFWVEEIHIQRYWPSLDVLPHCHAMIHASEFTDSALESCQQAISEYCGSTWDHSAEKDLPDPYECVSLPIDIDIKPVNNAEQFKKNLEYMAKPIDLVRPYRKGIDRLQNDGEFVELNQAVDDFLDGHYIHCLKRQQLQFIGSLDPKRKRLFLGNQ